MKENKKNTFTDSEMTTILEIARVAIKRDACELGDDLDISDPELAKLLHKLEKVLADKSFIVNLL